MRPALYYPWVYLKGGAERMILELMTRSGHEWTLYTNRFEPQSTFPALSEVPVVRLPEVSVRRTIKDIARAGLTMLTQRVDFAQHDSLFVVSEGLGNLMVLKSTVPTSCICLTPLRVVYEPHTRERFFAGRRRPHYRMAFSAYRTVDRRLWNRYVRVFANSEEVRRRIAGAGLVDESRLEVVHHGVDLERWRPSSRADPFFLVPGRIMWQKNVELALDAWIAFKSEPGHEHFRLVVAGMVDQKSLPYLERLKARVAGRPDVEFVTGPSEGDMLDLYERCWAVVFPPFNEDWGLVPLEAMACGKPVLATDKGGPKESVLDGFTGFLRPPVPERFAAAMAALADMTEQEREEVGQRARARACEFPWSRFVGRMDEHVWELAGDRLPVMPEERAAVASGRTEPLRTS